MFVVVISTIVVEMGFVDFEFIVGGAVNVVWIF